MRLARFSSCVGAVFVLASAPVFGAESTGYSYSGETGPANWGSLAAEYSLCSEGERQSPIDIDPNLNGNLQPLDLQYAENGFEVLNNGHTVQINFEAGTSLVIGINSYQLLQIHFHTPSENTISGNSYPMEGHLVHADDAGNLAVLAIMFELGSENSELNKAWSVMPGDSETNSLTSRINPASLVPSNLDYYQFVGSLTTPPCSEGVTWLVLKNSMQISQAQLESFRNALPEENNRPVQPLNGRLVVE